MSENASFKFNKVAEEVQEITDTDGASQHERIQSTVEESENSNAQIQSETFILKTSFSTLRQLLITIYAEYDGASQYSFIQL